MGHVSKSDLKAIRPVPQISTTDHGWDQSAQPPSLASNDFIGRATYLIASSLSRRDLNHLVFLLVLGSEDTAPLRALHQRYGSDNFDEHNVSVDALRDARLMAALGVDPKIDPRRSTLSHRARGSRGVDPTVAGRLGVGLVPRRDRIGWSRVGDATLPPRRRGWPRTTRQKRKFVDAGARPFPKWTAAAFSGPGRGIL